MALHGEIKANGMTIGAWEAQRAAGEKADPGPDDLVTYDCMVRQDSTLQGNEAVLERFEVTHRFGEGALALAALVLEEGLAKSTGWRKG